jgi:hypothetical protein
MCGVCCSRDASCTIEESKIICKCQFVSKNLWALSKWVYRVILSCYRPFFDLVRQFYPRLPYACFSAFSSSVKGTFVLGQKCERSPTGKLMPAEDIRVSQIYAEKCILHSPSLISAAIITKHIYQPKQATMNNSAPPACFESAFRSTILAPQSANIPSDTAQLCHSSQTQR